MFRELGEQPPQGLSHAAARAVLEAVLARHTARRRGLRLELPRTLGLPPRQVARWFYAQVEERVIGVLVALRLEGVAGYVITHLAVPAEAPVGTSELLVSEALSTLGREQWPAVTFGPAAHATLGAVHGLSPAQTARLRRRYAWLARRLGLQGQSLYYEKFATDRQASYVLTPQPRFGLRQAAALLLALHRFPWLELPRLSPWRWPRALPDPEGVGD